MCNGKSKVVLIKSFPYMRNQPVVRGRNGELRVKRAQQCCNGAVATAQGIPTEDMQCATSFLQPQASLQKDKPPPSKEQEASGHVNCHVLAIVKVHPPVQLADDPQHLYVPSSTHHLQHTHTSN